MFHELHEQLHDAARRIERWLLLAAGTLTGVLVVLVALAYGPGASSSPGHAAAGKEAASRDGGFVGVSKEEPRSEGDRSGPRPGQVLCSNQGELLYLKGSEAAVAADERGHFTYYGFPDPDTGRPTRDSYDLLRDCAPGLAFYNDASVVVDPRGAGRAAASAHQLGESGLRGPTRVAPDGSLRTTFGLPGGVKVSQRLALTRDHGVKDTLGISYTVANTGPHAQTVSLRSVLSPPLAVGPGVAGGVFLPAGIEPTSRTRNLQGEDVPEEVVVPRRGAASDASGRWQAGSPEAEPGPAPSRLILAGWMDLYTAPFDFANQPYPPLPRDAALAVYWEEVTLRPGETTTFSERYGPAPRTAIR